MTTLQIADHDVMRGLNMAVTFALNLMKKAGDDQYIKDCILLAACALKDQQTKHPIQSSLLDVDFWLDDSTSGDFND